MESNQQPHPPQQQPPHSLHQGMHSIPGNPCPAIPHLMDSHHHHSQPINLGHQQSGHQMGHAHPHQNSHHPVPNHHLASAAAQQFLPFGINFNSNNMGSSSGGPSTQHMNPYHGYHHHGPQIQNQQQTAHAMNMNQLQQTCFMQHAACMQHFQPSPQSLVSLNNHSQRAAGVIGWMNGPSSSMPIANPNNVVPGNHSTNNNTMTSCGPTQNSTKIMTTPMAKNQPPPPPDPNATPGGLEILWRELPVECQKLIVPQDIPDTARFRGYFTVCELLVLKRALEARYLGSMNKALPILTTQQLQQVPVGKSSSGSSSGGGSKSDGNSGRKNLKRGGGNKERNSNKMVRISENYNTNATKELEDSRQSQNDNGVQSRNNVDMNMGACEQRPMSEDHDENSLGELMISLDSMKDDIHTDVSPAVTGVGVGGVVKEAMEALSTSTTTPDQNGSGNQSSCGMNKESEDVVLCSEKDSDELIINENESTHEHNNVAAVVTVTTNDTPEASTSNVLETMNHQKETSNNNNNNGMALIPMLPSMPGFSTLFVGKKNTGVGENMVVATSAHSNTTACVTISEADNRNEQDAATESQKQLQIALNSITGESPANQNTITVNTSEGIECCNAVQVPVENRYTGPPPPHRTATLVLKLLQIGSYHIRSFSGVNPNRLRVLFNTQRMTYECQLPILPNPGTGSPSQLIRKVLSVDIGFDQISMIRFGIDSLWMRVEGPPLLTISVSQAQDEAPNQILNPHDHFLLDQIEKGQLKLSPIHQLFFLNERLVQSLESQLREHPRFRHLLAEAIEFRFLPPNFALKLTTLTKLDLSRNELKRLPDNFGSLEQLVYLDISKNQLQTLPLSMGKMRRLQYLNILENPFRAPLSFFLDAEPFRTNNREYGAISTANMIVNFLAKLTQETFPSGGFDAPSSISARRGVTFETDDDENLDESANEILDQERPSYRRRRASKKRHFVDLRTGHQKGSKSVRYPAEISLYSESTKDKGQNIVELRVCGILMLVLGLAMFPIIMAFFFESSFLDSTVVNHRRWSHAWKTYKPYHQIAEKVMDSLLLRYRLFYMNGPRRMETDDINFIQLGYRKIADVFGYMFNWGDDMAFKTV